MLVNVDCTTYKISPSIALRCSNFGLTSCNSQPHVALNSEDEKVLLHNNVYTADHVPCGGIQELGNYTKQCATTAKLPSQSTACSRNADRRFRPVFLLPARTSSLRAQSPKVPLCILGLSAQTLLQWNGRHEQTQKRSGSNCRMVMQPNANSSTAKRLRVLRL